MTAVVFSTPGELDLKAITTFGLNAKPNTSNPIGYFGTGLKYAIAVLVRNKIPITLMIGERQYEFYVKDTEFRDKAYGQVMMRQRNSLLAKWRYTELPFTTMLGRNWDLWQAFRELESNTRDENGQSDVWNDKNPDYTLTNLLSVQYPTSMTHIIVADEKFVDCYYNRDNIFLPGALTLREGNAAVQIFEKASHHLYYRGLRVMELPKPSKFTYNILETIQLTEDRTVKSTWDVGQILTRHIVTSTDKKLIADILDAGVEQSYESTWDFTYMYATPSEEFKEVFAKKRSRRHRVIPSIAYYYDREVPTVVESPPEQGEPLWKRLDVLANKLNLAGVVTQEETDLLDECVKVLAGGKKPSEDEIPF